MTVWPCTSGLSVVLSAIGSLTLTPCCSIGATSIMMMSSTSITSTSGVTLISALIPPLAPPTSIDIAISPEVATRLRRLLDEVVDELRRGVVHLHVEVFDARRQVVVDPDRRDGDDQAEGGFHERFGNTDRHGAETRRARRADALERVDDADHRAEQS